MGMIRKCDLTTELRKVADGKRTKLSVGSLAEIVLAVGYTTEREPKTRKREDVRFLETLYRLQDERE